MKKKGFTLIELLAVIVILAIIALIATPLVLKYIEKSRGESKIDSAYSFVRNLENEIANFSIKNKGSKYNVKPANNDYFVEKDFTDSKIDTSVKGDTPDDIKVCLSSLGQVDKATFKYGKYYVSYDGKKGIITDEATYNSFSCSTDVAISENAGLYDSNNNLLYTWDELVNNYGIDIESDCMDYDGELIVEISQVPTMIISENSDLSKGVKLVIDDSVTKIGAGVLAYNTTLTHIIMPNTVINIGNEAFAYSNLTNITLSDALTSIGHSAFFECLNLTSVVIPKNVNNIEEYVFSGCSNLASIAVDKENSVYDSRNNSNAVIKTAANELIFGCINTVIPGDITSIAAEAFIGSGVTNIKIPNSVTSIGANAFQDCKKLTSVVLPNKLKTIENHMFKHCNNLISLTIPKSVTSIGDSVFYGCNNLKEINYEGNETEWNNVQPYMPSGTIVNYNQVIN